MKHFAQSALCLAVLMLPTVILGACSNASTPPSPEAELGLIGNWQSLDDANYIACT